MTGKKLVLICGESEASAQVKELLNLNKVEFIEQTAEQQDMLSLVVSGHKNPYRGYDEIASYVHAVTYKKR
jgi:hypothetical protein